MLDHRCKGAFILTACVSLLSSISLAKATTSSSELKDGSRVSGVKVIQKKLSDANLSVLGVIVGSTKLSDVKSSLGGNEIYHEGDAGNSLYVLCYEGNDGAIVTFESGEMGGSDHLVTSIGLFGPEGRYRLKNVCSKSSKVNLDLALGGVQLGMSKDSVKKSLGLPSKEQSKILLYQYGSTERSPKGMADISSSFEIHFVANKISYFFASKIESY